MKLHGIGVSAGVASGPIVKVAPPAGFDSAEGQTTDVDSAYEEVSAALATVESSLRAAAGDAPDSAREVLTMTADLATDRGLARTIKKELKAGTGKTRAVHNAADVYAAKLHKIGGYFAERVTDLFDVRDRVIAELLGLPAPGIPQLTQPSIIVADDLAPADTASLDPQLVLGIVTERGGPTSHTAILAAQLGIPAVVQVIEVRDLDPEARVVIDGASGEIVVDPSDDEVARLELKACERDELISAFDGPGQTSDGTRVQLLANIGTDQDALLLADADVDGVGLFRTEFLFLDRHDEPSVEEQTTAYTRAMRDFSGRKFVARTLDAGADKPLAFADQGAEENPALGVRGLRLTQRHEHMLDAQLEALAAAAEETGADLWVMAPMIGTAEETEWFTDRARKAGLQTAGIMVEVPAAAIRAHHLFEYADFASIGTNDLTQYTMAADRMNGGLGDLLSAWQPAVIDLVNSTCDAALDKPVGVCGESAGDPLLALVYVGLGVTSLSMAVRKVPAVRAALAIHGMATCRAMADATLLAPSAAAAREAVLELADPRMRVIA